MKWAMPLIDFASIEILVACNLGLNWSQRGSTEYGICL